MSEGEITRVVEGLARVGGETEGRRARLEFSEEQRRLIRDSFASGASDAEFEVLIEIARARRLDPLLRQIHFVSRWDGEKARSVWAAQVSIDGLRAIAERTGLYAGQDEPEFVHNPDNTLKLCKVRVWRRDWPRPSVGVAYWAEYVQTVRDRQTGKARPTAMWGRMPHVMLAKCAESVALRRAFPEDMSGLYTGEEMGNAPGWQGATPRVAAHEPAAVSVPERHPPTVLSRVETRVEQRVEVPSVKAVERVPVVGVTAMVPSVIPVVRAESVAANDTTEGETTKAAVSRAVVSAPTLTGNALIDYLG